MSFVDFKHTGEDLMALQGAALFHDLGTDQIQEIAASREQGYQNAIADRLSVMNIPEYQSVKDSFFAVGNVLHAESDTFLSEMTALWTSLQK